MTVLKPGTPIPTVTVESVSAERMKAMAALMHDPNPIHIDVEAVKMTGLGDRVINQGVANLAPLVNALLQLAPGAALERLTVRYYGPVFAEDTLVARGEVQSVESDDSGEKHVTCTVSVDRDGSAVLSGTARVRIPRGGKRD